MREDDRTRRDDEAPDTDPPAQPAKREPPETARRPAPGIEHEPEPSGENLIPAKDGPGTL
jgi:hypothetical protein